MRPCMFEPMPCSPRSALKSGWKRKLTSVFRCGLAAKKTEPPLPPSPPLGPPRGTNFSRRKAMHPRPPLPAATRISTSSTNIRHYGSTGRALSAARRRAARCCPSMRSRHRGRIGRRPFITSRGPRGCPVSDFDRVFLRKIPFVPSPDEDFDDSDAGQIESDEAEADSSPAAGREGLPPTFRMRADLALRRSLTSRPAAPPVHLIAIKDIDGRPSGRRRRPGPAGRVDRVGRRRAAPARRRRKGRYELIAGREAPRRGGRGRTHRSAVPAPGRRRRAGAALAEAENLRTGSDGAREPGAAAAVRACRPWPRARSSTAWRRSSRA